MACRHAGQPGGAGHRRAVPARLWHVFDGPDFVGGAQSGFDTAPTQLSGDGQPVLEPSAASRVFVHGGLGTSFDSTPLPPTSMRSACRSRSARMTLGKSRALLLRRDRRLPETGRPAPDFVGGPVFAGAWLENGDAFDTWRRAAWRSNGGAGFVMDTLLGPVTVAGSWSFDGRWRTYLAVGRTFR